MNLTPNEKSLKDLLEDMGPGSQQKQARAELTLRVLGKQYEGITYDQAIMLYEENANILLHTPWTDPAHEYLITQRDQLLKLAGALNDVHILGRHDHEIPVHALVSVGGTAVECTVHVPKLNYMPALRNKAILSTIASKASASSQWAGSLRRGVDIDYVEL